MVAFLGPSWDAVGRTCWGCHLTTYPKGAVRVLRRGVSVFPGEGEAGFGCVSTRTRTRWPVFGALPLPWVFPDHALLALSLGWRQVGAGTGRWCDLPGRLPVAGGPQSLENGEGGEQILGRKSPAPTPNFSNEPQLCRSVHLFVQQAFINPYWCQACAS